MDARPLRALGPRDRARDGGARHRHPARAPSPEQGFRTCLGVLRLYRGLAPARAEAVSARATAIGALTTKSIASILANNLDRTARPPEAAPVIDHPNLRGAGYFH